MADGYSQSTRPYPSDAPALVTDWNPACLCSHARGVHEADGDWTGSGWRMSYGACEVEGCDCARFRDEAYGDED